MPRAPCTQSVLNPPIMGTNTNCQRLYIKCNRRALQLIIAHCRSKREHISCNTERERERERERQRERDAFAAALLSVTDAEIGIHASPCGNVTLKVLGSVL